MLAIEVLKRSLLRSCCAAAVVGGMAFGVGTATADDFYKGKQIRLVISIVPGGAYDIAARLVARHMQRHIPGNPTIVAQNIQGATGMIGANYVSNIAPKDGTVIAAAHQSLPLRQLLGDKNVKYDAATLQWIGSPQSSTELITVWHTAPAKTLEEAKVKEVVLGATTTSANSYIAVALANNLVGTKFNAVLGYTGNDIPLAMERGEVQGRAGQNWAAWKTTHPHWIRDKKIIFLAQVGLKPDPELPGVPMLIDFAKDEKSRRIMIPFMAQNDLGKPMYMVPEVPRTLVTIIRKAFDETMKDPGFLAEAKEQNFDISPTSGEELDRLVAEIMATPKDLLSEAEQAMKY